MVGFATGPWQADGATRYGDLSYGIYLYGWPIEQGVRYALGADALWWQIFLLSMPVAALLALISWHLVEFPARSLAEAFTLSGSSSSPGFFRGKRRANHCWDKDR